MAMVLPFFMPVNAAFPLQTEAPLPDQWPRIPYFFTITNSGGLEAILKEPYQIFLETGEHHALDVSLMQILSSSPDFALSLTTPTAYHQQTSQAILHELRCRFGFDPSISMHIATCLQEALITSIVHANCDIDMAVRSVEELERHHTLIVRKLAAVPYRDRRISIIVWDNEQEITLAVANQGRGFTPSVSQNQPLFLIQRLADKLWIGDDQRTLFMSFTH